YDNPLTRDQFEKLNLPASWWHIDHAEFWGYFSPMKAGITSADIITTVSPRYAREIRTPAFGEGFDGLLAAQTHKIVGIINGIDDCTWDPRRDPLLPSNYSADDDIRTIKHAIAETLSDLVEPSISRLPDRIHSPVTHSSVALMAGPAASRPTLPSPSARPTDAEIEKADEPTAVTTSERRGLTASPDRRAPMFGFIGRFVEQKGLDLVLAAIPRLLTEHDLRFVLLGSGQPDLESRARELALLFPEQVRVQIGYDETLAHRIEAAADFFLMPSRFEPCGLNQLYSLRYGTIPIVSPIGGLADSVVDADSRHLEEGTATGFHLRQIDTEGIVARVRDVMAMWHSNRDMLDSIARRGMQLDLGWSRSAAAYRQLYEAPLTRPIEDLLRGTTLHSVNDPNT
ncbi:MAG: glycogen synthase, partial [Thioalkalivibrionaceae bacterium]